MNPSVHTALRDPAFDLVGKTPLLPLARLFPNNKGIEVFAKLEYANPSGSIKDRIVAHILREGLAEGVIRPGGTIIEATSGNTGAALAFFCARLGMRLVLTTPAKTSEEKKNYMVMLGAELVVCPNVPHSSPDHYQKRAAQIAQTTPDAFFVDQYNNPRNLDAHYRTTGPEIWAQMRGAIDWFVAGGSTGGTVSATGRYLKERNPALRVLLPDPVGSALYGWVKEGRIDPHSIGPYQTEGVGKDHVSGIMESRFIDDAMQYTDAEAFDMCHRCMRTEGVFPGLSGGGNLAGVAWLVDRLDGPARIVTIIPDSGVKYLSKLSGSHPPKSQR